MLFPLLYSSRNGFCWVRVFISALLCFTFIHVLYIPSHLGTAQCYYTYIYGTDWTAASFTCVAQGHLGSSSWKKGERGQPLWSFGHETVYVCVCVCVCVCVLGKYKEWADFDIKQCKPFPLKTHLRMQAREFVSWLACLAATYSLLLALFIFYLFELIELSLRLYFEPVKALPSFSVSANKRGKWPCTFLISGGLRKYHNTHLHQQIKLSKSSPSLDVQNEFHIPACTRRSLSASS